MKKVILVLVLFALVFGCTQGSNQEVGGQKNSLDLNLDSPQLSSGSAISNDLNFVLEDSIKLKAIREKNAGICKQISFEEVKENCFLNVALATENILICDLIDSNSARINCVQAVQRRK